MCVIVLLLAAFALVSAVIMAGMRVGAPVPSSARRLSSPSAGGDSAAHSDTHPGEHVADRLLGTVPGSFELDAHHPGSADLRFQDARQST